MPAGRQLQPGTSKWGPVIACARLETRLIAATTNPARQLCLPPLQLYAPVLQWAQRVMGIRLEPTDSIFGATLGEQTLVAVEKHLQVGALAD